jgi:hypothetical protein
VEDRWARHSTAPSAWLPEHRGERGKGGSVKVSEQARKIEHEAIPQWAEGLYYNKGFFSEALIYHDGEALYFEIRGKDSGVVRLSFEMLETLTEVIKEEQTDSSPP